MAPAGLELLSEVPWDHKVVDSQQSNLPIPDYQTLASIRLSFPHPWKDGELTAGLWLMTAWASKEAFGRLNQLNQKEQGKEWKKKSAIWTSTNRLQAAAWTAKRISDSQVKCVTARVSSGGKGFTPGRWEGGCGAARSAASPAFPTHIPLLHALWNSVRR